MIQSQELIQDYLNDLDLVWENKPIWYLPISTLVELCGVNLEDKKNELESKWLVVIIFKNPEETQVRSWAFYVYHYDALTLLLNNNKNILEKNNRPLEAHSFVKNLKIFAEDPDLFHLIMIAFNDPRLKNNEK